MPIALFRIGFGFFVIAICFVATEFSLRQPISVSLSLRLARYGFLPGLAVLTPALGFGVIISTISTAPIYILFAALVKLVGVVTLVVLLAEKPDYNKLIGRALELLDHNYFRALLVTLPWALFVAIFDLNVGSIEVGDNAIVGLTETVTKSFVQLIFLSISAVAIYVELRRVENAKLE